MHRIDGAGHVNHLFVSEDPATSRPPTEITPEIMNAFQEELATFIEWAGIILAKGDNTQLRQGMVAKFAGIPGIQGQTYTAFTTTGATGAFVLTPIPALTVYGAGQRFRVKFHAVGNGADSINVSGLGNKSLKQYDSTGAKVAAVIVANQLADIEFDGADFVILDPLPSPNMASLKNRLINGNFAINQRAYVSGTNTTVANQYTLDRWRVVTSGQNVTWVASGAGSQITAPAGGIEQVIEAMNIEGGTYCLSWTGTATATVNGVAIANGGTVALPSNANATVRFSGGTVAQAQLERALSPTPFDQRPFGVELILCQRYYESGTASWMASQVSSTSNGNTFAYYMCQVAFKVEKRAAPTISNTAPSANPYVITVSASADTKSAFFTNSSSYSSGTPTGNNAFSVSWTANSEI